MTVKLDNYCEGRLTDDPKWRDIDKKGYLFWHKVIEKDKYGWDKIVYKL